MTSTTLPAQRSIEPRLSRRRDRWLAIGVASALHLAILALFLGSRPPAAVEEGTGSGAMDVSLSGLSRGASPSPRPVAPAAPAKAAPVAPAPLAAAEPIKPRSVVATVSDILNIPLLEHSVTPQPLDPTTTPTLLQAAPASGSPGAACDISGAVQTALQSDPATHDATLRIPLKERGVANAVMMWNGAWIDPSAFGGEAVFTTIRAAILQIVANAQVDCRDQAITGPRFMLIPEGDTTMIVVFGNASWRWSDLLTDPVATSSRRNGNFSPKNSGDFSGAL